MDELTVIAWSQREPQVLNLIESWMHQDIPDENTSVEGFHTVQADRQAESRKEGVCLFFLTTGGVLAYLQSKSGFIAQTLNFMLLNSGHIICPGNLSM